MAGAASPTRGYPSERETAVGLTVMILGLVLFLGVHTLTTQRGLRTATIARLGGEARYKAAYSLASAVGLALTVWGFATYRATGWVEVWQPPTSLRHLVIVLIWPAIILIVAAYLRGYIYLLVRHPMLTGVMLWALAHLLANGDLGSIVLFGSFFVWAAFDRITLMWRKDRGAPPMPLGGIGHDALAVIAGTLIYLALAFVFHPIVIGVPVFGV
jgi:uncharacterized membrane protein